MAHDDDNDRPTEPASGELPAAPPPNDAPAGAPTPGEAPQRRRRRRRRRGPRPPGEGAAPASAAEPMPEGEAPPAAQEGAPSAPQEGAPPGAPPARAPRRPRWRPRRNKGPRPPGGGAPGEGQAASARGEAQGEAAPREGEAPRAPPGRGRRTRDFRAERHAAPAPAEPARERPPRDKGPRRDRPPRRPGKGPPDRGRDARHKPEPKLYTTEAVVDRGFEDLADPANEGATLRVHWTIVKRTVADQRTTKPVSMLYILKRGESEAEFANLSLARAAVNKTIVHPEKLTLSKEQHAAARGKK